MERRIALSRSVQNSSGLNGLDRSAQDTIALGIIPYKKKLLHPVCP